MKPALPSLAADLRRPVVTGWTVTVRDLKGHAIPVAVESAESEAKAISAALNQAARFGLGTDLKAVSAHRTP